MLDAVSADHADDLAQALDVVTERHESLEAALAEIRQLISMHGGEATATEAGLDSAVIETLVTVTMADTK